METNEVLIRFNNKPKDSGMTINWEFNPNTDIVDLFNCFETSKEAFVELVNNYARKQGVETEEQFKDWLYGKRIKDLH